ncbi:hypothetical protein K466DRAFT_556185 [Polyporus arcularius HHB13444]|uniref:Uncharacterized protein n=1 Tax=Polyporus arcularius HHB13444 TaxID=1314778 RepID=A0A5C3P250_9APHY|nr:hypothetical protein K466DRAFT_556185 [Polyporus arcularius HHB13444]
MWLLDTWAIDIISVSSATEEPYAILSHVWDDLLGEDTFQDIHDLRKDIRQETTHGGDRTSSSAWQDPRFRKKTRDFCAFAHAQGDRYVWMDTCCINRSDTAELSDAINAMYEWYSQADVCYAFLWDVTSMEDPRMKLSMFRRAQWFTRSWTLQELIAPRNVVFLSKRWEVIGTKESLVDLVEEITTIPADILLHRAPLDSISVARRMSWAAPRRATLVEDEAYSLMGLFGVSIPAIYGVGRQAFIRLQQQIFARTPDHSIFAWGGILEWEYITHARWELPAVRTQKRPEPQLFAGSPVEFGRSSSTVSAIGVETLAERVGVLEGSALAPGTASLTLTDVGVRAGLPLLRFSVHERRTGYSRLYYLGILACEDEAGRLLALVLLDHGSGEFSVDRLWQFRTLYRDWEVRVVALPVSTILDAGALALGDFQILQSPSRTLPALAQVIT